MRVQQHRQHFGICHGCPLSRFLFVILVTLFVGDAKASFQSEGGTNTTSEVLYVDDTLLIDVRGGGARDQLEFFC